MGCHPLSTVLYLKQVEARARGERIAVSSVTADPGNVAGSLPPQDHVYIKSNPLDVEDWGMLTLTFSDGTKGTLWGVKRTFSQLTSISVIDPQRTWEAICKSLTREQSHRLARSKSRAADRTLASAPLAPTNCRPIGRPAAVRPHGVETAGC